MKAQNANHSSAKTRKLIKAAFAKMLSEKRTMDDITVTELVKRADINRGTFYIHYDDIYAVAEDYENELIDRFFDDTKLLSSKSPEAFIDSMFDYIRKNDESYKIKQKRCLRCRHLSVCLKLYTRILDEMLSHTL